MSKTMNDWRITQTAIDNEMLRLASLLAVQVKPATAPAGLTRHEARAANTALANAVQTRSLSFAK